MDCFSAVGHWLSANTSCWLEMPYEEPAVSTWLIQLAFSLPEDVCLLPAPSAGRGEQAAHGLCLLFSLSNCGCLSFAISGGPIPPEGSLCATPVWVWIWQSNRFHHFPDCAGTAEVGQIGDGLPEKDHLPKAQFVKQLQN
jgi:hypothetical protein